jgi:hypothetical protein
VPAYVLRKTHHVHVHHYNIGMIFVVLIAYQDVVLAVFAGIANGWMIEGVTVYAPDPVFKRRELMTPQSSLSSPLLGDICDKDERSPLI